MVLKKDKDREKGAQLIRDEAKKISTMLLRLSHATSPKVHSVYSWEVVLVTMRQELLV